MVTNKLVIMIVEGWTRSVIRSKGVKLGGETGVKQVSFQVFPKGCDRGIISYLKGERVPKNRGKVTERIRKMFV